MPRNLEFKIYKIETGFNTQTYYSANTTKTTNMSNLFKLLQKNKNLQNTNMKYSSDLPNLSNLPTSFNSSTSESESSSEEQNVSNIIENNIYKKLKIYYCEFIKWHPREPINYENIMNGAKFVLDENALNSWGQQPHIYD